MGSPGKNRTFGRSLSHALDGVKTVVREERNMRSHLVSATLVVALGAWLGVDRNSWCWLALAIVLVWLGEFLNTALEAVVDLLAGDRYLEAAKRAKDVAAGLVLVAGAFAVVIGLLVLGPPLILRVKELI